MLNLSCCQIEIEFPCLKVVLVKPLLTVKDPDLLVKWYESLSAGEGTEPLPLPSESEIFKTGASFVNFIHLYIVIATEIGVFHDLGPMCITLYKEVMFSGKEVDITEQGLVEFCYI